MALPVSSCTVSGRISPDPAALLNCIQTFEALTELTEAEFLDIGSRLRDFHIRISRVTETASSVAGLMSGAEIALAVEGLREVIGKMSSYFDRSESAHSAGMAKFSNVAETTGEIHGHAEELRRITKLLRTLGISNAIQNAVLKRPDEGIRVLGEDVKNLSGVVAAKTNDINGETHSLLAYLEETLSRLGAIDTGRRKDALAIMKTVRSGLDYLIGKYELAADTACGLSAVSADISRAIGDVVTSLQFHDITRQQFEESIAAFRNTHEIFFGSLSARDAVEERGGDPQDAACGLMDFFAGQIEAVMHTRDEFVSAVMTARNNLAGIAAEVKKMVAKTSRISGGEASSGGLFLSGIKDALSSITSALETLSRNASGKELSAAVGHAGRTADRMAAFIRDIEEIGDDIELTALNASVKADMIGADGKPLGVIAQSIQRVSAETQVHTEAISSLLKSIVAGIQELSVDIAARNAESDTVVKVISDDLNHLANSLNLLNERAVSAFEGLTEEGRTLSGEIAETADGITVHALVDKATEGIVNTLAKISSPREGLSQGDARLQERAADARRRLKIDAGMERAVPHAGGTCPMPAVPGEFGENVELF